MRMMNPSRVKKIPLPWMGEGRVRVTKLVKTRHSCPAPVPLGAGYRARAGEDPECNRLFLVWVGPGFLSEKHIIHCSGN